MIVASEDSITYNRMAARYNFLAAISLVRYDRVTVQEAYRWPVFGAWGKGLVSPQQKNREKGVLTYGAQK